MDQRTDGAETPSEEANAWVCIGDYVKAFEERDLARSMAFYADDARLTFVAGVYQGKQEIAEWHKARFAAEAAVRVKEIKVEGDTVTVYGSIASNRLRAWKIPALSGWARFKLEQGKIKETSFGLRAYYALDVW
jgi:ketosteroid isomerase-like protein